MELYKRPDSPYWWASVPQPSNPRPKRFSTKRRDKKEALRVALHEEKKILDRHQLGVKAEMTLAEGCERYLMSMEDRSSYADLCRNRDKLLGLGHWKGKVHALPADMKLSQLKTHHVTTLREKRKQEGLSANSIKIEIRFVQRVYNLARMEWGVMVDPDVSFPVPKTEPKTRYLSKEEEAEVLAILREGTTDAYQRARCLFILLIDSGLRLSEALNLRWSQIERDQRRIRVYRSKTKSWSIVPLSSRANELLECYLDQSQPFLHMDRAIKVLRRAIDRTANTDEFVIRSSGRATIHSLRDTYATRLVQRGMSLYKVSKLLGHTSTAMSSKYSHLEIDTVADEALTILET